MAQQNIEKPNGLDKFMAGPEMQGLDSAMWMTGVVLAESGMISERDYNRTTITKKHRISERAGAIRRPVSLANLNRPDFTISAEVYKMYLAQFSEVLTGPFDSEKVKSLAETYSTYTAWGEFIFTQLVNSSTYNKPLARLAVASKILTDRSDFEEQFTHVFENTDMKDLMKNADDAAVVAINGLRAGVTLVRGGLQEKGMDVLTDDVTLGCNAALENYVEEHGPKYTDTSTIYMNTNVRQAVGAFSYAIPEWLYVMAVPLKTEKLMPLMDDKWLNRVGPIDWNPSFDIQT